MKEPNVQGLEVFVRSHIHKVPCKGVTQHHCLVFMGDKAKSRPHPDSQGVVVETVFVEPVVMKPQENFVAYTFTGVPHKVLSECGSQFGIHGKVKYVNVRLHHGVKPMLQRIEKRTFQKGAKRGLSTSEEHG